MSVGCRPTGMRLLSPARPDAAGTWLASWRSTKKREPSSYTSKAGTSETIRCSCTPLFLSKGCVMCRLLQAHGPSLTRCSSSPRVGALTSGFPWEARESAQFAKTFKTCPHKAVCNRYVLVTLLNFTLVDRKACAFLVLRGKMHCGRGLGGRGWFPLYRGRECRNHTKHTFSNPYSPMWLHVFLVGWRMPSNMRCRRPSPCRLCPCPRLWRPPPMRRWCRHTRTASVRTTWARSPPSAHRALGGVSNSFYGRVWGRKVLRVRPGFTPRL